MLERCFHKVDIAPDVDLAAVADGLDGTTGADIAHACREALMCLLRRDLARNHAPTHDGLALLQDRGAEDLRLTAEDVEATVARARRSVRPEEVARFEGMRDALLTGSLPAPAPQARGGSEQVERLAKAMLKERAAARITQLQGLLRDAAGVMRAQQHALFEAGVATGGRLQPECEGQFGEAWGRVMEAVAALAEDEEMAEGGEAAENAMAA